MSMKTKFGNLVETKKYIDSLMSLQDPNNPNGGTVTYPRISGTYNSMKSQSIYMTPISMSPGNNGGIIDFNLAGDLRLNAYDNVKLQLTITNGSATNAYISPALGIFDNVSILPNGSNSSIFIEDGTCHLAQLFLLERDFALKVLADEGHQVMTNESFTKTTVGTPNSSFEISDLPALYPNIVIPPGSSRKISYWVLGSPLTVPGFTSLLFEKNVTLRFKFRQGSEWIASATPASVAVTSAQLQCNGVNFSEEEREIIRTKVFVDKRPFNIPFISPNFFRIDSNFVANQKYTFQLQPLSGSYAGIFYYLGPSAPSASNFPTSFNGIIEYVQNVSPQRLQVDLAADTATLLPSSYGEAYAINNLTFYTDGSVTNYSPDLSTELLEDYSFVQGTGSKSYLLPTFKSYYFLPFSTNMRFDLMAGITNGGGSDLNSNSKLQFSPVNTLTNTSLYIVGFRHARLAFRGNIINVENC